MDWIKVIQLAIQYGPLVKQMIDQATSNQDLVDKVTGLAPAVGDIIANVGSALFPKSTKALQQVGGAIAAFDPNTVKWLQKSLNTLTKPSPNLEVDGVYGAKTKAAVEALQTQLGLKVDGIAGMITQAAINGALAALSPK